MATLQPLTNLLIPLAVLTVAAERAASTLELRNSDLRAQENTRDAETPSHRNSVRTHFADYGICGGDHVEQ